MANISRHVLITDAAPVLQPAIKVLEAASISVEILDPDLDHAAAVEKCAESPVLIVGFMPFGADELSQMHSTKLLIRAGIGYDMVDVDAATNAGILVVNVPDFCLYEVADHTLMLLLAAIRRLPEAMNLWRTEGSWHVNSQLPEIRRVKGTRLGLIGLGRIGRMVATRAQSCGLEVVCYDPFVERGDSAVGVEAMDLDQLLATSDAISLHCPLTADTHHLIDEARLEKARDGVIIVNTSRGGLVDLEALDAAVVSGKVRYAALDVLDGEPTPDLAHPILSRPNVLVTSHAAWYSEDAKHELATNAAAEATRFLDGERPLHVINPQALDHA